MHLLADAEFWVLLAVVIFAAAVWKPMRRAVTGSLDERAARIRAELDEAKKLRDDAEQLLAQYQQKQREAAAEAEAKALDEIRAVAVDAAIGAARAVIVAEMDEARGGALLDEAIAALPQRLR